MDLPWIRNDKPRWIEKIQKDPSCIAELPNWLRNDWGFMLSLLPHAKDAFAYLGPNLVETNGKCLQVLDISLHAVKVIPIKQWYDLEVLVFIMKRMGEKKRNNNEEITFDDLPYIVKTNTSLCKLLWSYVDGYPFEKYRYQNIQFKWK